jgi:hypothetical protein
VRAADLRPGARVLQARVPLELLARLSGPELAQAWQLMGRTGTVDYIADGRTAFIEWDDGTRGRSAFDCLELIK